MTPAPVEPLLTRDEVARLLKVKPREVTRLGIRCVWLGPKMQRYLPADVQAFILSQRDAEPAKRAQFCARRRTRAVQGEAQLEPKEAT